MTELEIRELLAREKEQIEQIMQEHERREKMRRVAERNCEWWNFISEEQQDNILNLSIEIFDILEKSIIPTLCELWERLKEWFSTFADQFSESMTDFAKSVMEAQTAINAAEKRGKTKRFFKRKKWESEKIIKFTMPEKRKFRKWRYSVYGHHR